VGQTLHRKYLFYTYAMHWNTPVWLDGVDCTGSEDSIVDCKHRAWGINDCNHDDDVSIACYDNTTFPAECECRNSLIVHSYNSCARVKSVLRCFSCS